MQRNLRTEGMAAEGDPCLAAGGRSVPLGSGDCYEQVVHIDWPQLLAVMM